MEAIFKDAALRQFSKGQILLYEGDLIETIYFIVSGYIKVSNILANGNQRTIVIYSPGEAFPLISFLSGAGVARYFYECMTDVQLKVMPQKEFQQKVKGNLELGEELIAYSYRMNSQFTDRIETLTAQGASLKIAGLFKYLAYKSGKRDGDTVTLELPLTTQEIADMSSLTRETTTLKLNKLKKSGVISGRRFLSINMKKLNKILGE